MKSIFKKSCLVAILLTAFWATVSIVPTHLPAQDIDDVIEGLDKDFSLGGKEEVKQSNVAAANEQNREDVQIQNDATVNTGNTVTGNLTVSWTAGPPTNNFTWNSLSINGTVGLVGQTVIIPSGTVPVTLNNITVPAGVSFQLGINLTCNTSPTCNATIAFSGVVSCSPPAINMVLGQTLELSATCTTAAI